MINELHTAIVTWFNVTPNDFYTSISGNLAHAGDVPRGWSIPYAVFSSHSIDNDDTFEKRIWSGNIQFTVFGVSAYATAALLKQCVDHFDGARLTITDHDGGRLLSPFVLQTPTPIDRDEHAGWQAAVDFDVRFQET